MWGTSRSPRHGLQDESDQLVVPLTDAVHQEGMVVVSEDQLWGGEDEFGRGQVHDPALVAEPQDLVVFAKVGPANGNEQYDVMW